MAKIRTARRETLWLPNLKRGSASTSTTSGGDQLLIRCSPTSFHYHRGPLVMDTSGNDDNPVPASFNPNTSNWDPDSIQADVINKMRLSTGAPIQDLDTAPAHGAQNTVSTSWPKQSSRRFFGIRKRNVNGFSNTDDYELKYPEDAYGEEMGPTARVWRTYLDEAQKADAELIEGWRDTTDVLLVFAGLFSAVVATFVVQTSTNLQPDYAQITASLLVEQNALLRATANHTSVNTIPPSTLSPGSDFLISNHDRWVNGLWFTSLSVSLVAAFMAVLAKQWVQHYVSVVSGTPHDQVRIRQFRFLGVERWHMPLIISTLPMLLHLSLLLYFSGLILFLWPLDAPIAYTIVVVAVFAYGFYMVSNVLPLWYPLCPYKTPLSSLLAAFISSLRALPSILISALRSHYSTFIQWVRAVFHIEPHGDASNNKKKGGKDQFSVRRALYHMKEVEKKAASKRADEMDAEALVWLHSSSSNPTVASLAVQAVSGLRLGFLNPARKILKEVITFKKDSVEGVLLSKVDYNDQRGQLEDDRPKVERFLRACHQLGGELTDRFQRKQTYNMISNTGDPTLEVLSICHFALHGMHVWYPDQYGKGARLAYLRSFDYANEKCTPFMWSVVLRYCQREAFDTSLNHWLFGVHVLNNFLPSSDTSTPLRHAMLLEYFCSLSEGGVDKYATWGEFSVLNGSSPFLITKVLPQIYSALLEALTLLHTHKASKTEPDSEDYQRNLLQVLKSNLYFLRYALYSSEKHADLGTDREKIRTAASALRLEMKKLMELEFLWNNDSKELLQQRSVLCDLYVNDVYWPSWMSESPWKISWTPGLMDFFLQSYDWDFHWADKNFVDGDLDVYRLFGERDGLSQLNRRRHCDWFRCCYLGGLVRFLWKGDPADLEQHLDYLFVRKNLERVVEEFIITRKPDGGYEVVDEYATPRLVGQLFVLRSPNPDTYGEYLIPLHDLVKDHPDLWQPKSKFIRADQTSESNSRWRSLFSSHRKLVHWISGREKTNKQSDVEGGVQAKPESGTEVV